jgi:hypothetical protein
MTSNSFPIQNKHLATISTNVLDHKCIRQVGRFISFSHPNNAWDDNKTEARTFATNIHDFSAYTVYINTVSVYTDFPILPSKVIFR